MNSSILHAGAANCFPDAAQGDPCCMGYAVYGPGRCTCWEPVYDVEQKPFDGDPTKVLRKSPCADCAYRAGSPERTGQKGYRGDDEELQHLADVCGGWCARRRKVLAKRGTVE